VETTDETKNQTITITNTKRETVGDGISGKDLPARYSQLLPRELGTPYFPRSFRDP